MKNFINVYEATAVALLSKPDRTATFEEIAGIIEKKGLLTGRKSTTSLAKEIELRTTASASKYKRWFSFQAPDTLTLKDMS